MTPPVGYPPLLVIRALNDGHIKTRHPLEVVVWTDEEGPHFGLSALGSGVAGGSLGPVILERKGDDGLTLADWLRRYGQDAAVKDLLVVRDVVTAESGRQVGTVGYMKAERGVPNVIPGRVEFPFELRDLDAAKIDSVVP
jgi:hypothetical protein